MHRQSSVQAKAHEARMQASRMKNAHKNRMKNARENTRDALMLPPVEKDVPPPAQRQKQHPRKEAEAEPLQNNASKLSLPELVSQSPTPSKPPPAPSPLKLPSIIVDLEVGGIADSAPPFVASPNHKKNLARLRECARAGNVGDASGLEWYKMGPILGQGAFGKVSVRADKA